MTEQGTKSRKLLIVGIVLILAAVVVATVYVKRIEKERLAGEAVVLMDKGMDQFRQQQYALSLETLGGISEDIYQNWHINYYMGSALIKLKNFEPAAAELEKAYALNNKEHNVLFALGVVYYKLGNLSLSKAYFAKVLEIDPGNEEAKGLMDIMANLERQQPDTASDSADQDNVRVLSAPAHGSTRGTLPEVDTLNDNSPDDSSDGDSTAEDSNGTHGQ